MANYTTKLEEGDKAPEFSCKDENGKTVTLRDFRGKKLILYFYPKDKTPSCTNEACNLSDNYSVLKSKGYAVLGVSADDEIMHGKFIKKYDLPFSLLADTNKKVITDYDVCGMK